MRIVYKKQNVRRDVNLISGCLISYVSISQKKKELPNSLCAQIIKQKNKIKPKYIRILLYSKFNYMKRWLRTKSKASKISTNVTFKNTSRTHIVKTYLPHDVCTLPCH